MTAPAPSWRRHLIPELGLSFAVNPDWAMETVQLDVGTVVSQRLPDGSAFFVRYGPGQTLDRFLAGLGDMLTTVTIVGDQVIRFAGLPARRVTVRLDRRPIPRSSLEPPTLLSVTGFPVRGEPVLVGYRLREDRATASQAALEWTADNVAIAEADR